AAVFGVWRVIGMSRVFARIFLVAMFVMAVIFVRFFAGFCRGRLDGGRIGQGHRCQRLARVSLGASVIRVLVIRVIVFIVGMLMIVLMMLVIVMPGIIMVMLRIGVVMFGV